MKNFVNLIKKPVVWITSVAVCTVGLVVGLMVKFKDKIFTKN